jgi:hypothetical protein
MTHMNRSQRRAARAKGSVGKLDRVVAAHEAGHAVARILVADDFGLPPEKMISYIDVGLAQAVGDSFFNKSVTLVAQATTFGPKLSAELQSIFHRTVRGIDQATITKKYIMDALAVARSEGVDVDRWLRARMLISTLASAAEAIHTERSIEEVWNSFESESDLRGAIEDGICAGISDDQIPGFVNEALERSEELIRQATVQSAIQALADALPDQGRLTGRRAAFIINQALQASTAPRFIAGEF